MQEAEDVVGRVGLSLVQSGIKPPYEMRSHETEASASRGDLVEGREECGIGGDGEGSDRSRDSSERKFDQGVGWDE